MKRGRENSPGFSLRVLSLAVPHPVLVLIPSYNSPSFLIPATPSPDLLRFRTSSNPVENCEPSSNGSSNTTSASSRRSETLFIIRTNKVSQHAAGQAIPGRDRLKRDYQTIKRIRPSVSFARSIYARFSRSEIHGHSRSDEEIFSWRP